MRKSGSNGGLSVDPTGSRRSPEWRLRVHCRSREVVARRSALGASRHRGAASAIIRKVCEKPTLSYITPPPLSGCWGALGPAGICEAIMHTPIPPSVGSAKERWNKSRLIGQKRPLKPKEVWAIRGPASA